MSVKVCLDRFLSQITVSNGKMNSGAPSCVCFVFRLLAGCMLAGLLTTSDLEAQNSLTAWWAFDGDYTSQVNNDLFAGVAIGDGTGFTSTSGQFISGSQGLRIDGTAGEHYVDVTASPILDLTASITVSGWYQYNDLDGLGSDERNFVWETAPGNNPCRLVFVTAAASELSGSRSRRICQTVSVVRPFMKGSGITPP